MSTQQTHEADTSVLREYLDQIALERAGYKLAFQSAVSSLSFLTSSLYITCQGGVSAWWTIIAWALSFACFAAACLFAVAPVLYRIHRAAEAQSEEEKGL